MSNDSLEKVDLDSLLLNLSNEVNDHLLDTQSNYPVSTVPNIEIPQVSMETNAAAAPSTISTGNAEAKPERGLVVLDDDKDSSLIDITKENEEIIILSPDTQSSYITGRQKNMIHLKPRRFTRSAFVRPIYATDLTTASSDNQSNDGCEVIHEVKSVRRPRFIRNTSTSNFEPSDMIILDDSPMAENDNTHDDSNKRLRTNQNEFNLMASLLNTAAQYHHNPSNHVHPVSSHSLALSLSPVRQPEQNTAEVEQRILDFLQRDLPDFSRTLNNNNFGESPHANLYISPNNISSINSIVDNFNNNTNNNIARTSLITNIDTNSKAASPQPQTTSESTIRCPICLEDLEEIRKQNNHLMAATCGHIICKVCLDSLKNKKHDHKSLFICPCCKKPWTGKSKFMKLFL